MKGLRVEPREAFDAWQTHRGVVFLDVRGEQAYAGSDRQIPGALRIPLDELEARIDRVPRDKEIVAYCT